MSNLLYADLTALIERQIERARERVTYYEGQEQSSPGKATRALFRSRMDLARWEAERRVLGRHSPLEWWVLTDGDGGRPEPDRASALPTMCRACTSLKDEDAVAAIEYGDSIDLGTPIVAYPCDEVRDLAARLGIEVPA